MTSQEKILEKIFAYLNRLAPPGTPIHPDIDLIQELGLDSIKVMDLLMEMEDEFDISIPLNVLTDVRTPAQLAHAVIALLEPADGTVR
ncbi:MULTISPECIES: acyl carrier protein [Pseudomonas]|jgi:acyl carrier protein|uniref:Acyl carrier protein n=2 Tax=Pseudomonas TaxID=286 RepID=A0A2X2CD34_PSELU|nr:MULTISPECIES: acyl carrier protein [Pseudomonas]AYN94759.1 acyl carrier protein [Pseudomonas sp. LTJR-52]ENA29716.1 acyl carrier protein [Pseudomonas sp. HPB0071]MBA1247712.1 acyl carrier protein [Pseudomonas zeshuii]MBF8640691.1 acyl carrier protein [Pseudomonas zeshuii]MBH3437296.1 acyl carrier protein [Pseudomonas luteola]